MRRTLRIRESEPGHLSGGCDVPVAEGLHERFYDWRDRLLSKHDRQDVELAALIHASYERSHYTYGARRVHAELREGYGVRVGRKRVARLMRRAGLKGVQKRRFRCTTRSGAPERWAPDLVERNFVADRPDALW